MKRITLLLFFVFGSLAGFSQNLQLHYDFLKDRNYLTSTIEMFKPDAKGSTFFFVDMNYGADKGAVSLAYFEIARNIKFGEFPIQAHVEYNGGLVAENNFGLNFNNAYLVGGSYGTELGKFSVSATAMYKAIANTKKGPDFQLTGTWFAMFANNKLTFTGFIDFWSEDNFMHDGKKFILLTEPQLWFNINEKFAVGTEVEISNNFVFGKDFQVFPTLAVKCSF